ncbi:hypothetical protein [Streptomyces sp. NPDC002088]|uniref:hypothetical protein n=1 Tax=Streptomyces sp. NPDC002088 TaxID=3154665 RepID=UPI00331A7B55
MSDDETAVGEEQPEDAGEPRVMSERTAKLILAAVAVLAMWGIVAVLPETAYVVVGVLGCLGWQKAAGWIRQRRGDDDETEEEAAPPDVGEALRRLVGDDKGVLLTVLCDDLGLPNTKAVKALLEAEGIPWKPSRTREGNGPAVRREAIPPAPSPVAADSHGDGCCCRSGDNNNSNNGTGEGSGERLRAEPIGLAATVVHDPAESVRHHQVRSSWGHSGNGAL